MTQLEKERFDRYNGDDYYDVPTEQELWNELTEEDWNDVYDGLLEQEHLKFEQWRNQYEQIA